MNYPQDIFDVTKVISQKDYPLIEIGQMVLDENPTNNFEDIEELAFSPANLVPGIEASPDKLLQGRLFGYKDAERYRLGANYEQLPINRPKVPVHNYERDGVMAQNQETGVNYEPNSQDGPLKSQQLRFIVINSLVQLATSLPIPIITQQLANFIGYYPLMNKPV